MFIAGGCIEPSTETDREVIAAPAAALHTHIAAPPTRSPEWHPRLHSSRQFDNGVASTDEVVECPESDDTDGQTDHPSTRKQASYQACKAGQRQQRELSGQGVDGGIRVAIESTYGRPAGEVPAEVEEDVILDRLLALRRKRVGLALSQKWIRST